MLLRSLSRPEKQLFMCVGASGEAAPRSAPRVEAQQRFEGLLALLGGERPPAAGLSPSSLQPRGIYLRVCSLKVEYTRKE